MQSLDFLPERIKAQRTRLKILVRQGYLIGTCVVVLLLLGYTRHRQIVAAEGQVDLLTQRKANSQRQIQMMKILQEKRSELLIKKRIDGQLGSRIGIVEILSELEKVLPEAIALNELKIETATQLPKVRTSSGRNSSRRPREVSAGGGKDTSPLTRLRVDLIGLAPSNVEVAAFLGQLTASDMFEDVRLGYSKNADLQKRTGREFSVSCYVMR